MKKAIPLAAILTLVSFHAGATEIRLGVLAHDVGVFGTNHEDGPDANLEVLFDPPPLLDAIWAPRPHLGATVNAAGHTSQAYAGLTWTWNATRRFFMDFSFGGAIHNGRLHDGGEDNASLGSRVLFRESLSLGFRLTENHSLSVMLSHISNANLADSNEGMDNLGLRWGYTF